MFFKREVHILDAITEHWMRYVVLCDARLLQKGGRKLVGILRLVHLLRKDEQITSLSLGSAYSHRFQIQLPTFFVNVRGMKMNVEIYMDPLESQDDKLRFHLIFSSNGLTIAEKEVNWSSKPGPDLIHAYKLIELVKAVAQDRDHYVACHKAHVLLERELKSVRRSKGLKYRRSGDVYQVFFQGQQIAVVAIRDSAGGFITSMSYEPGIFRSKLPPGINFLDAMLLT
jgi:hypothetical protein